MSKRKQKNQLTAETLTARARALAKLPGFKGWIDGHPHKAAIIAALKAKAPLPGIVRALQEAGDKSASLGKLQTVLRRIVDGVY